MLTPAASGQRFLIINGNFDNQELADIIRSSKELPEEARARVPEGKPGERLKDKIYSADSSKSSRILGLNLDAPGESLQETTVGLVQQLLELERASN